MPSFSFHSHQRLAKWQWAALFAAVAGLIVVTLVLPIIAQQRERATYSEVSAARSKGPELLAKIGAPPGATGAAFRTVDSGPKRRTFANAGKAWLSWSHLHATELSFPAVLAWYTPRLKAAGWKLHTPENAAGTTFCDAPWLFEIKPAAPKGEADEGSHPYELRLRWDNQFIAGSCQHP